MVLSLNDSKLVVLYYLEVAYFTARNVNVTRLITYDM